MNKITFCVVAKSYQVHLRLDDNDNFIGGPCCTKGDLCGHIKVPLDIVDDIHNKHMDRYASMPWEEFLVKTFGDNT